MIVHKSQVKEDDLSQSINQWFSQRTAAYNSANKAKE